jgi:hypothetical protein
MAVFDAKERNKPVRIGINSSGISVFNDQLRVHFVVWQSMHQLEFQRKTFTIRLKPGEVIFVFGLLIIFAKFRKRERLV